MLEEIRLAGGVTTVVLKEHADMLCSDGFVFEYLLRGHPDMKQHAGELPLSEIEFSVLCGIIRRGEIAEGIPIEYVRELNDIVGGFRTIDRLLKERTPRIPEDDTDGRFLWDFLHFPSFHESTKRTDLEERGFQFASLKCGTGTYVAYFRRMLSASTQSAPPPVTCDLRLFSSGRV